MWASCWPGSVGGIHGTPRNDGVIDGAVELRQLTANLHGWRRYVGLSSTPKCCVVFLKVGGFKRTKEPPIEALKQKPS